jgi:hypothetical protein
LPVTEVRFGPAVKKNICKRFRHERPAYNLCVILPSGSAFCNGEMSFATLSDFSGWTGGLARALEREASAG